MGNSLYSTHYDKRGYWDAQAGSGNKRLVKIHRNGVITLYPLEKNSTNHPNDEESFVEKEIRKRAFYALEGICCIWSEKKPNNTFNTCVCTEGLLVPCAHGYTTEIIEENGAKKFMTSVSDCGIDREFLFEKNSSHIAKEKEESLKKQEYNETIKAFYRNKELLKHEFEQRVMVMKKEEEASVLKNKDE